ncbi:MAG: UDP-N-acetylmuramoyl-tripeptide-D-alanyl-D-alanine ligase [Candidatus Saccharibacteria bacterium]|nr:UDP-N-acetylmuramoyl-tripeptide-D-alanyl-D-alanine ligase [Candidatus Saccharibacteria bacterium]MDB5180753.1 UDP-N-acetylmuramoyl-tripeptide-D-alanyl-D-alanine ligase [Candidatus Saccharibacteria bacterium]
MFKNYIQTKLERAVQKYFKKHPEVKLVVVVGSVGKTSTKVGIGTVLSEKYRVRLEESNYNSPVSVPLAILGIDFPEEIRSVSQWLTVFKAVKQRIKQPTDVDVIVQELSTSALGQIAHYGTYLQPDVAVVTAVSAEHMENFKTLDNVAAEELAVVNFSKQVLINRDNIDGKYAANVSNAQINTYGTNDVAEYRFDTSDYTFENSFTGLFYAPEWTEAIETTLHLMGDHSIRTAVAAGAVGVKLGLSAIEITNGMQKIRALKGHMNVLRGMNESIIIDDTYTSSPLAVQSALQALYQLKVPQKIAVFGSMDELGETSAAEHEALGAWCDPLQLTHVVTVGEDAEKYLAPAARIHGCHTVSFKSPIEAGAYVHKFLEKGSAVLFKGAQDNIFLEEAVKVVLHSTEDEDKLVRQSPEWMAKKQKLFDSLTK